MMETIFIFIVKAILVSGALYLYYQLALKNRKFHSYNRFYLLSAVALSLLVPFMNIEWIYVEAPADSSLHQLVNGHGQGVTNSTSEFDSTMLTLTRIAMGISGLLLLLLIAQILRIYSIKRNNQNIRMKDYVLIETAVKQAPFSFLNNLFWKKGLSAADKDGEKIFKHELAHIREKHSLDKLVMQMVSCLFWVNPFYWLIQKELSTIHEFIADAAAVEAGDTESFARMLLYSHNEGRYLTPAHSFFNSSIKRRLIMISQSNKTQYSYLRRILVLPLFLFVLATASVTVTAQQKNKATTETIPAPSEDTIPKAKVPAKVAEAVTVTGYKKEAKRANKQRPQKVTTVEPIIVEGKKLEKISSVEEPEEVTVVGYKTETKAKEPTISAEPVTVVGYKAEAKSAKPAEEVAVVGYALPKKAGQAGEVTVKGKAKPKPAKKSVETVEPIVVNGKKLKQKPSPKKAEPVAAEGKKMNR